MNFLKNVAAAFSNQVVDGIVGLICSCGMLFVFATQVETFLQTYVLPRWYTSPILTKCFVIAIVGCLFSHVFDFLGRLLIGLLEYIIKKVREVLR